MKKQIFIATAFIAATSFTNQLIAQDGAAAKTAGYDLKKNVKCRISSTSTGCDISFTNEVKSPRDPASGLATGKRQHKPYHFSVSSADNSVTEIKSPRDVATGQSSGKRTAEASSISFSKVTYQWIKPSWDKKETIKKIPVEDGEFTVPTDSPDGDYEMIVSWSWGATNQSSGKSYSSCHFMLSIQDGVCHAINTKGTGGSNK
jgi:hypothetical protein